MLPRWMAGGASQGLRSPSRQTIWSQCPPHPSAHGCAHVVPPAEIPRGVSLYLGEGFMRALRGGVANDDRADLSFYGSSRNYAGHVAASSTPDTASSRSAGPSPAPRASTSPPSPPATVRIAVGIGKPHITTSLSCLVRTRSLFVPQPPTRRCRSQRAAYIALAALQASPSCISPTGRTEHQVAHL